MANQVPDLLVNALRYRDATGVNDNDVVIQSDDISQFDTFLLHSTGGAMDVLVSIDGTNYSTAPLSLQDMGAVTTTPVIVTVANRVFGFRGKFSRIRVLQNGVTAVAGACLMCGNT